MADLPTHAEERSALAWDRYRRLMKWMLLAAGIAVVLALLWLASDGTPMSIHMIVATIAGVGLSVLVGTALMGLVFVSARSGHDDNTGRGDEE